MKSKYIKNFFLLISITLLIVGCRSGRPHMSKNMEGKGAVQDIEMFNVKNTAENFRKTSDKFATDVKEISKTNNSNNSLKRRIPLNSNNETEKVALTIVDHNKFVKKLETSEVSLKLNDMDIKSAFKLFASLVQRNIIIGDEVTGNVTVDFENLRWGSAVYVLLDMNNLIMDVDNDSGLLRVHSKEIYEELEKAKIARTLEVNKNVMTLENGGSGNLDTEGNINRLVITEIFRVFYQKSEDIIEPIQEVLGEDSEVEFINDEENNQLLVKGTPEELNFIESVINKVDVEKKQVLVEAYIINASDKFQENFNNSLVAVNASQLATGSDGISYTGVSSRPGKDQGFTFNNDTTLETENSLSTVYDDQLVTGGAVIIGNLGMASLKAVIEMSINDGNSETISNPKLFAMDGEEASLTQGNTLLKVIPASGDAAGSTVEVPQNLTITVTPDVMGDNKVKLNLTLNNDVPGDAEGEDVATTEQSLTSKVLLNNGEIAVLGGVYVNTKNDNSNYVPFFSKIPLIGTFFRNETKQDDRTQLLIFISANIV